MAVQEDISPKREFWRGLTVYGLCICAASICLHAIVQGHPHFSGDIFLTASCAIGICAAFGAATFCFTRFVFSRAFRHLLAAMAFSTLVGGYAAQGVVDYRNVGASGGHSWILTVAWLVAAALLQSAGHAQSLWKVDTRRQRLAQMTLAGLMVVAFPAAAVPYALDKTILPALTASSGTWFQAAVFGVIAAALAPGIILAALVAYYRRYHTEDDRLTGTAVLFLRALRFRVGLRRAVDLAVR